MTPEDSSALSSPGHGGTRQFAVLLKVSQRIVQLWLKGGAEDQADGRG